MTKTNEQNIRNTAQHKSTDFLCLKNAKALSMTSNKCAGKFVSQLSQL